MDSTATPARIEFIRVEVAGKVHTYDADIAGLAQHLSVNGRIIGLQSAIDQAKGFFAGNKGDHWLSLIFWVTLDDAPLAYRIEVDRKGHHRIFAASPLPGAGEIPADGIWRP